MSDSLQKASEGPSQSELTGGIATLFFRNKYLLWLTIVVIFIAGLSASITLPRLEDPRIVNRGPLVVTSFPGASAERVETLVTDVLEEGLNEITAIKDISSTSRAGASVISILLEDAVMQEDTGPIFAEIRDKVGEIQPLLPAEAGVPFVDDKRDPVAFTVIIGISAKQGTDLGADLDMDLDMDLGMAPSVGLLNRLAEELADQLRNVSGTELVRVYGSPTEEITVEVDRDELAEIGLSPGEVAARIGAADTKQPAGVLRAARSNLLIEVDGELDTLERIASVPVVTGSDDSVLTVGDVATVTRGWQTPVETIGLVDGRRSVFVAARVQLEARVDQWAVQATDVIDRFEANHANAAVVIDRVFEQEPYTSERLVVLISNLLAGAGVIMVAVFIIMGFRPALVVASTLPMAVALVLMGWLVTGELIHQMSIFGLIIALGLLIDNAIVMTDDVVMHKAAGMSSLQAVNHAVRHLFLPLSASTITTALAFAPIMLLPGGGGDFVGSIGTSVVMAITASFVLAVTVTAALAGWFTKPATDPAKRRWYTDGVSMGPIAVGYRWVLSRLYTMPVAAIAVGAALPFAGLAVAPTLGNQFFPPVDRNMFEVRVWMPSDSAINATAEKAAVIEETLKSFDDVEQVSWLVGGSFPSVFYNLVMDQDGAANYAHGTVTTTSAEATKKLLDPVQWRLDEEHPEAQILVRKFAQGPPVVADIEYRIFGPNLTTLQELGDQFRVALQSHPDVLHTQATIPRGEPKLFYEADEDAARLAGMTLNEVAAQLQSSLEGGVSGSVIEGLEQMPVRVRYTDVNRQTLDKIASTPLVQPGADRWTHAAALGEFKLRPEMGGISRYNRERTNVIKAYVRNGSLPIDIGNEVLANFEQTNGPLPAGYRIELGGAAEQDSESSGNLATFAPILVAGMIVTLILVFRSIRCALILGGVAFFSLGLALLSTWFMSFPISFNTILGTLGLIGVALNDSIVVLAAIRADPKAAAGDLRAMVDSVIDSTRHIIATTATTIGGFLPLLLFVGGDFWPSLAIVLVGGIAGATLIALVYVPGAYLLLMQPWFAKRTKTEDFVAAVPA